MLSKQVLSISKETLGSIRFLIVSSNDDLREGLLLEHFVILVAFSVKPKLLAIRL